MNKETLQKGIAIQKRIDDLQRALESFEEFPSEQEWDKGKIHTREPKLIIDRIDDDWDGRDQVQIPASLNSEVTRALKEWLESNLAVVQKEFKEL
jgi:hypothetical protein